ncbi:MAG TPA: hypothetical protein VFF70_00920 [Anaerolineae bacterium]|nr:hypothetical protein [Anaerolineae bacterium]
MDLFLATAKGLVIAQRDDDVWRVKSRSLDGKELTCVASSGSTIYVGALDGVYRSTDRGQTWIELKEGLSIKHARWIAYHADRVFVGTEPANIFVLHEGESMWHECTEVAKLRDVHQWFLPYSPEAGCIRGFAFHGSRAYAAAEVGGSLRSNNHGETWALCGGSTGNPSLDDPPAPYIYPDVHSVEVHPSSADLLYAPTGGGFYRSMDGGQTWKSFYDCYVRAAWIDPIDPNHIILGPADGVSSNGRIEESRDGGKSWKKASNGLDVPWRRYMVERFVQVGDDLLAVLSNGQLLSAALTSLKWQRILVDVPNVNGLAALS